MDELTCLRDELYAGSWAKMTRDLRQRLKDKGYVWRLAQRIQGDLKRIKLLRKKNKNAEKKMRLL